MLVKSEQAITNADRTFFQLRKDIVEGIIPAGSKLSEMELSTKYEVSRGARVVALSPEGLIQLYQVREALEGMAARLAARYMSDEEIADMQALLDSHFDKVKDGQSYYQEAGDVDFHYRIVTGSKNDHLISVLVDGLYHLVRMYRVQLGMAGPRVSTAFDEHRHIVNAIANRDEELAEMLMRRHILYSKNNIEKKLNHG